MYTHKVKTAPGNGPSPCRNLSSEIEDALLQHRCKLAFLTDVFGQPIARVCEWEFSSDDSKHGLFLILRNMLDEVKDIETMNETVFTEIHAQNNRL